MRKSGAARKGHHVQEKSVRSLKDIKDRKLWDVIISNYDMIQGAQLSNSLIILKVLDDANEPLNAGQISEIISRKTQGRLFKVAGALRDSLEYRLRREGFVEGVDTPSAKGSKKHVRESRYSMTHKGRKLLIGWTAFLSALE